MYKINHELLAMRFAESGFNYRELEEETEVCRTTLHLVMKGSRIPTYQVTCRICVALGLSQEDILIIFFPYAKSEKELIK